MAKPKASRIVSSSATDAVARTARSTSRNEDKTARRPEDFHAFVGVRSLFNPLWCFHGFRLSVIILTLFGVIMVFSSSTVSMVSAGRSPFSQAISQGMYCVMGLVVGVVFMCLPARMYRRFSFAVVLFAMLLQLLTFTPLGVEVNGNAGWIGKRGVFTMQPAEVMKLALCIWLPAALHWAKKHSGKIGKLRAYAPLTVLYLLCLGFVMLGKDLGTAMIVLFIGFVAFLLGGYPGKVLAAFAALGIIGIVGLIAYSPNRLNRVLAAYQECSGTDAQKVCYQSIHAKYALAEGGPMRGGVDDGDAACGNGGYCGEERGGERGGFAFRRGDGRHQQRSGQHCERQKVEDGQTAWMVDESAREASFAWLAVFRHGFLESIS